jgi:hypothetical protein
VKNDVYKNCHLVSRKDGDGFRVEVRPFAQSNVTSVETLRFQREEDAIADAKIYIDSFRTSGARR